MAKTNKSLTNSYLEYYGLCGNPFANVPNPKFLYFSDDYKEALSKIVSHLKNESGFVLLTGEDGIGKTILANALWKWLPEEYCTVKIDTYASSRNDLVQKICSEFGIENGHHSLSKMLLKLHEKLNKNFRDGKKSVLIIDDVDSFSEKMLREILILTKFGALSRGPLKVILVGNKTVTEKLETSAMSPYLENLGLKYSLRGLTIKETMAYVNHRLSVAGNTVNRNLFTKEAIHYIHFFTGGNPYHINMLCDKALKRGYVKTENIIDARIINEIKLDEKLQQLNQKSPEDLVVFEPSSPKESTISNQNIDEKTDVENAKIASTELKAQKEPTKEPMQQNFETKIAPTKTEAETINQTKEYGIRIDLDNKSQQGNSKSKKQQRQVKKIERSEVEKIPVPKSDSSNPKIEDSGFNKDQPRLIMPIIKKPGRKKRKLARRAEMAKTQKLQTKKIKADVPKPTVTPPVSKRTKPVVVVEKKSTAHIEKPTAKSAGNNGIKTQKDPKSSILKMMGLTGQTFKENALAKQFTRDENIDRLLSEIKRIIRNLDASTGEKSKIIGITSAVANEGTTTLSGLLSLVAAERQNRSHQSKLNNSEEFQDINFVLNKSKGTLLIDAHLKEPSLHEIFDVNIKNGFYELLSNNKSVETAIKIISPSLRLITAGNRTETPLTDFEIQKLRCALDKIKFQFDFVFVDIPPVLQSEESISLCKACDGVILDVGAGVSSKQAILEAKELLEKAGVNIWGTVLNKSKSYLPQIFSKTF